MFRIIGTCLKLKFSKVPNKNLWTGGSVLEKSYIANRLKPKQIQKHMHRSFFLVKMQHSSLYLLAFYLLKNQILHNYFSMTLPKFLEHVFSRTTLNGCLL